MDTLFHEFLREAGLTLSEDPSYAEANQVHGALLDQTQSLRTEIANLEEQRESLRKRLDRGAFLNKLLNSSTDSNIHPSLNASECPLNHQSSNLEQLARTTHT